MDRFVLTLVDGRTLEVTTSGNRSNKAVVFHHGTPGATSTWDDWLTEVSDQGGFAIAYSRPGYGTSSRHEGRTVASNAADIADVLGQLGVERIVSIGWSGGGPHALADTTLPHSAAAISIAGVGAYNAADLNFLDGMGEENHVEFKAATAGAQTLETWMKENTPPIAVVTGDEIVEAFGGLIGEADKQALNDGAAEGTAKSYRQALVKSFYGWMDDDLAFVEPWGFDISKISVPVELWQGNDDFMVPHAHGYWLEKHIPSAKLHFVPGEGHISLGANQRANIIANALSYLA